MNAMSNIKLPPWLQGIANSNNKSSLAAPILIIMLLGMMVLPLPAFVLDIFFSFNIALSVIVLLTSLYTVKPLDFMAFPTILLVSTMLRLSLNVASTRVVLTEGHTGGAAAGKVIAAGELAENNGRYGTSVIIETGSRQTLYAHLNSVAVKAGDRVTAGQLIGAVGETGFATGPLCTSRCGRINGQSIRRRCSPISMPTPPGTR